MTNNNRNYQESLKQEQIGNNLDIQEGGVHLPRTFKQELGYYRDTYKERKKQGNYEMIDSNLK